MIWEDRLSAGPTRWEDVPRIGPEQCSGELGRGRVEGADPAEEEGHQQYCAASAAVLALDIFKNLRCQRHMYIYIYTCRCAPPTPSRKDMKNWLVTLLEQDVSTWTISF